MKYEGETEEQFSQRVKEARKRGICIFRDDDNREFILDIIDNYLDIKEMLMEDSING